MATRAQIIQLRLLVNDPPGFVTITDVAAAANLPANPTQQTCYYLTDTARYVATRKETGALEKDYTTQRIRISDAVVSSLIDSLGADGARCRALRLIETKLGADMQLEQSATGGDVARFTSLKDMHAYYRALADECEAEAKSDADNSTGRVGHTTDPQIAGGLI
jgi:hypothetical protein